jgi:hypothetical protein
MKPDKKADDLLREKLNSYSSPVPAGLFDAMDKKRSEQQAANAFGWRIKAGISVMVLLLGVGVIYWQLTSTNLSSKTEAVITNTDRQTTSQKLKDNNQTQTTPQVQTEVKEFENSIDIDNNIEEKTFIDNTQQQTKVSNTSNSSALPTNVVKSTNNSSDDVIKQNTSFTSPSENKDNSFSSKKSNESLKENPIVPSDNFSQEDAVEIAKQEKNNQSILVDPLEGKDFFAKTNYHAAMPKIKCGWEARKVYIYFDAITSLDMAFRTLSPKFDDGEAYAILRNQTEGMQESSSLGFRASAVTKGGFAMRTGLIYSKIKEPFSQRIYTEYEEYIETTDQAGNILSRDTIIRTETQKFAFSNRHKLLDIPLILGYEIDKDKYNIGFNGGAYINITASQEGRFLNPNSEIVDFSTNSPARYEAFKTNVGMSLYSSFSVNYKITPALHFIFEPYGRYYLNSFTTENHELNQNYFVAGIQVGLRMKM